MTAPEASLTVADQPRRLDVRSGAELVALSERFYGGVFAGTILFVGLAALAALAVIPLRSTEPLDTATPAVAIAVLLVVAAPVTAWRAGAVYRLLRRRPLAEVAIVLAAAALIVLPLETEFWWPSCALLMLLAIVVPLGTAIAACVIVLGANLAAHVVVGDLDETAPVAIIGLWIGFLAWTATFGFVSDRLAAYILRLNVRRAPGRPPPLRVPAGATEPEPSPAAEAIEALPPASALDRLTPRQLQVVALLADGLRYRDVSACLSISVRQVERHVAHAIDRLGVSSVYELVAVAISEGLVPAGEQTITREGAGSRG